MHILIGIIGDRYFPNRHLIWQYVRQLPAGADIALEGKNWAGVKVIEGARTDARQTILKTDQIVMVVDSLTVFTDLPERPGVLWDTIRAARQRGLAIDLYHSSDSLRAAQYQMRLF